MAIALVQQTNLDHSGGATTSNNIVLSSGVTAGNALVLMALEQNQTGGLNSISGGGVTWNLTTVVTAGAGYAQIAYGLNSSGTSGSTTITANFPNSSPSFFLSEWSGVKISGQPDAGPVGSTGGSAGANITTTKAGDLVVAIYLANTSSAATPNSPFTAFTNLSGGDNAGIGFGAYDIVASPSTVACSWTSGGGRFAAISELALLATPGYAPKSPIISQAVKRAGYF